MEKEPGTEMSAARAPRVQVELTPDDPRAAIMALVFWNNAPERTQEEVLALGDRALARYRK